MPSLTRPVVKLTVSCNAPPTLGGACPRYEAERLSKRRHSNRVTESSTRSLNAVILLTFLMMVLLRGFAARAARRSYGDVGTTVGKQPGDSNDPSCRPVRSARGTTGSITPPGLNSEQSIAPGGETPS